VKLAHWILAAPVFATVHGCGLNHPSNPAAVQAMAPDKLAIGIKWDEEMDQNGYSAALSWDLD
jgi:hypothetical protein